MPRTRQDKPAQPGQGRTTRAMLVAAGSFTCFHTAMLAGSVVLPLYVTGTLHQPESRVGLLFTVCAAVEIPVALATMLVPARLRKAVILAGLGLFAAYFVLVATATAMPFLIGTQVARGIGLAAVGALGITYVQDLAPHSPGRATTLFANTLTVGSLLSGLLAGGMIQALGYRPALAACAALAVVGGVLLMTTRGRPAPEVPPVAPADLPDEPHSRAPLAAGRSAEGVSARRSSRA